MRRLEIFAGLPSRFTQFSSYPYSDPAAPARVGGLAGLLFSCQADVAVDPALANDGGCQNIVFPTAFPNSQARQTTTVVKKQ